jgi:NAD(P)-dependent dehydrogenase (short-subunit alcohol dehydrogenase family)
MALSKKTRAEPWALVLGASAGTGAAVARSLAQDPGWNIFGVHRGNYPESAAEVERDVRALGRRVHMRKGDGGTLEGVQQGAAELFEVAGPRSVKMMVHSLANASVGRLVGDKQRRLAPRQMQKTFDSMAHSFVYWTQELIDRDLLAPGAHILGFSNWMEDSVMRGAPLIAATKATLAIYVRHMAHELGPRGYRVNLLKFGGVFTPAVEKTFGTERLERLRRVLERVSASRRISTVDEVGRFVSVLAGDTAARFNGATIDFTGGESLALFDALMHFDEEETG